jgi:DUF1365 family protein
MSAALHSAVYRGWIRHRRYEPAEHSFRNRAFLVYLDLAESPELFRRRWFWSATRPAPAWFRRRDHWGDREQPLADAIADLVEKRTGRRPRGPIRLLTHLRYFGYCFNPVSFYYCFDTSGQRLETIVAEITNTPWREVHCYVLPVERSIASGRRHRFRFSKDFHVSPFLGMDMDYDWRFTTPDENLVVHMENHTDTAKVFDATMVLARHPVTGRELARCLLTHPLMTVEVIAAIHWQALKLWLKRVPVFPHPREFRETRLPL